MAGSVRQHMDSMSGEIQEMRRMNLFTPAKISLILKQREELAWKINRVSNNLRDFEAYILHEEDLLKYIAKRRHNNTTAARPRSIVLRIKNLYETALQRFSRASIMYLSYIKFCKKYNFITAGCVAVENMTKNCPQDPDVWLFASDWYAQVQNNVGEALKVQYNVDEALKVLNRGLIVCNKSPELYTKAINLVLSTVIREEDANKQLKTYVGLICEHIEDSNYLTEILNLLEGCSFTTDVQNSLIDKLLKDYAGVASTWHLLAQRAKSGTHYGEGQGPAQVYWTLCFSKYQEGFRRVFGEERLKLWSLYLDCLMEVEHSEDKQLSAASTELLKTGLQQASQEKCLSERYYLRWLELVKDKDLLLVLTEGISSIPQSLNLWILYLERVALTGDNTEVDRVFREGVEMLKEKSLSLWLMYLRYYGLLSCDDIVDKIYREAVAQPCEISNILKPRYLEWLYVSYNIHEVRKMYNTLANQRPYCQELHTIMCKLESAELDYDYNQWEKVYTLACEQFGNTDQDVWVDYILFHHRFRKSQDSKEKIQSICQEAINRLGPLNSLDFSEKVEKAISD